jgi:hypothetical protein
MRSSLRPVPYSQHLTKPVAVEGGDTAMGRHRALIETTPKSAGSAEKFDGKRWETTGNDHIVDSSIVAVMLSSD